MQSYSRTSLTACLCAYLPVIHIMADIHDCTSRSPTKRPESAEWMLRNAPAAQTAHVRTWRLTVSPGGNGLVSPTSSTHSLPIDTLHLEPDVDPSALLCGTNYTGDALELPIISLDMISLQQERAVPLTPLLQHLQGKEAVMNLPAQGECRLPAGLSIDVVTHGPISIKSLGTTFPVLAPRRALDPAVLARLPAAVVRRLSQGDAREALLDAMRLAAPVALSEKLSYKSSIQLSDELCMKLSDRVSDDALSIELSDRTPRQSDCHTGFRGASRQVLVSGTAAGQWDLQHWGSTEVQPSSTMVVRCAREALAEANNAAIGAAAAGSLTHADAIRSIPMSRKTRRPILKAHSSLSGTVGKVYTGSEKRLAEALRTVHLERVQHSLAERAKQRDTAVPRACSGGWSRIRAPTTAAAATAAAVSQTAPRGPLLSSCAPRSSGRQSLARANPAAKGGGGGGPPAAALHTVEAIFVRGGGAEARGGRRLRATGVEMYRRARQATKRKEGRMQEGRHAQEAAALSQCTFLPSVNRRPDRADTPRSLLHAADTAATEQAAAQAQSLPSLPEPFERVDICVAALISPEAWESASTSPALESLHHAAEDNRAAGADESQIGGAVTPVRARSGKGRANRAGTVHERLYAAALASRRKHHAAVRKFQDECKALRECLPAARPASSRTKGLGSQQHFRRLSWLTAAPGGGTLHRPAFPGAEECTFTPHTNLHRSRPASARGATLSKQPPTPQESAADRLAFSRGVGQQGFLRPASAPQQRQQSPAYATARIVSQVAMDTVSTGMASPLQQVATVLTPVLGQSSAADTDAGAEADATVKGSPKLTPDFSWNDFLQRQQHFLMVKERKAARVAAGLQQSAAPPLAPGSRRILKNQASSAGRWAAAAELAASLEDAALMGLQSRGIQASSPRAAHGDLPRAPCAENTSRPKHAQLSESDWRKFLGRSEADRLRHEKRLEDIRVRAGAAEERELTFRPAINSDARAHAVISLHAPELYLATVMSKQQQRQLQHQHNVRRAEEEELAQCTFAPRVTKLPSYIARMARSYAGRQGAKEALGQGRGSLRNPRPTWQ